VGAIIHRDPESHGSGGGLHDGPTTVEKKFQQLVDGGVSIELRDPDAD